MNVMSVVIMLIAGIGILNLLLMAVYERTREIGVLGALGFRPRQISWLFILEGTLIGLVGVGAGILLGLAFNGLLRLVGLDFTAFSSLTSYMALINEKVYPSWGMEKLFSASSNGGDHRRAGRPDPGPRGRRQRACPGPA